MVDASPLDETQVNGERYVPAGERAFSIHVAPGIDPDPSLDVDVDERELAAFVAGR